MSFDPYQSSPATRLDVLDDEDLDLYADVLVDWIAYRDQPTDAGIADGARERFRRYFRRGGLPYQLAKILTVAAGTAVLAGRPSTLTQQQGERVWLLLSTGNPDGWRWRAYLLYRVSARVCAWPELAAAVGTPEPGEKKKDWGVAEIEPEHDPGDEESEQEYA